MNGKVEVKGGTTSPTVTVYLRSYCANNPTGTTGRDDRPHDARPDKLVLVFQTATAARDRLHRARRASTA